LLALLEIDHPTPHDHLRLPETCKILSCSTSNPSLKLIPTA
jgi:hypothetical protein